MPRVACTYMPNASWRRRGGKAQRERVSPTRSEAEGEGSEVILRSKIMGKPLALRQGRALSQGLISLFVRVSAQIY